MTLFEMLGWIAVWALGAGAGWLVGREQGAALGSLLPLAIAAVVWARARRDARETVAQDEPFEPMAEWTLSKLEAAVESWSWETFRFTVVLLLVLGLPGAIVLAQETTVDRIERMWPVALLVTTFSAPVIAVVALALGCAIRACVRRERAVAWTNDRVRAWTPAGDWSAHRNGVNVIFFRGVVLLVQRGGGPSIAMPAEIAHRAGFSRETGQHWSGFD